MLTAATPGRLTTTVGSSRWVGLCLVGLCLSALYLYLTLQEWAALKSRQQQEAFADLKLVVLIIGCKRNRKIRDIQIRELSRYLPASNLRFYDEDSVEKCVTCNVDTANMTAIPPPHVGEDGPHSSPSPLYRAGQGWWCAQKRPLSAVKAYLSESGPPSEALPSYLMVMDDDTFLNVFNLLTLLTSHPALQRPETQAVYLGDDLKDQPFIAGGGGWLVTRPVLSALLQPRPPGLAPAQASSGGRGVVHGSQGPVGRPLPRMQSFLASCLDRQQGGEWCFFHSDWAVAQCIWEATSHSNPGRRVGVTSSDLFRQKRASSRCSSNLVTCHWHYDSNTLARLYTWYSWQALAGSLGGVL